MEKINYDAEIKMLSEKEMNSSKNSNIFSHNSHYYMDFFLRFIYQTTESQYNHEMIQRLRLPQIGVILSLLVICIYCSFNSLFLLFPSFLYLAILINIINSQGIEFNYLSSNYLKNFNLKTVKACNHIAHFLFIYFSAKYNCNEKAFYINLLISGISNFVFLIPWYIQAIENIYIGIYFLYCSKLFYFQSLYKSIFDLVIGLICQIIYGFAERNLKENWVLINSFKRSNNNFKKLMFKCCHKYVIIDETSKIIFFTDTVCDLFKCNENEKLDKYFLDANKFRTDLKIVHQKKIKISSKCMVKKSLKLKDSPIEKEVLYELINENIAYCKIIINPIEWKQKSKMCKVIFFNFSHKYIKKYFFEKELLKLETKSTEIERLIANYSEKISSIQDTTHIQLYYIQEVISKYKLCLAKYYKTKIDTMKILNVIFSILQICYEFSKERKINFILKKDENFPSDFSGNVELFETVLFCLINYITLNTDNSEILVELKLNNVLPDYYECNFIISCTKFDVNIFNELQKIITKLNENNKKDKEHYFFSNVDFVIVYVLEIIYNLLEGKVSVRFHNLKIEFNLNILFSRLTGIYEIIDRKNIHGPIQKKFNHENVINLDYINNVFKEESDNNNFLSSQNKDIKSKENLRNEGILNSKSKSFLKANSIASKIIQDILIKKNDKKIEEEELKENAICIIN